MFRDGERRRNDRKVEKDNDAEAMIFSNHGDVNDGVYTTQSARLYRYIFSIIIPCQKLLNVAFGRCCLDGYPWKSASFRILRALCSHMPLMMLQHQVCDKLIGGGS